MPLNVGQSYAEVVAAATSVPPTLRIAQAYVEVVAVNPPPLPPPPPPPPIVQTLTSTRASGGNVTLTLSQAPVPGNILMLVALGRAMTLTVPSGFVLADNNTQSYNMTQVFTKTVMAGDGSTYAVSGLSDWMNLTLIEVAAGTLLSYQHGTAPGANTTTTLGPIVANAAATLRLVGVEWDPAPVTAATPPGWTLLSPATFDSRATGNHAADLWQAPVTLAGSSAIMTVDNAGGQPPVWVVVDMTLASSPFVFVSIMA